VTYTRYVYDEAGSIKLDNALQGGATIDGYFSYDVPRMSQRIKAGVAEDVGSYVGSDQAVKTWIEGTKGVFKWQGKYVSVPTTREPHFFMVNKKIADDVGFKIPEKWTIEEFRAAAKQLSGKRGDKEVYGAFAPPDLPLITLGANRWYKPDGSASNFDHPVFRQGLELHKKMIDDKIAFPWAEMLAQNLGIYRQNIYLSGQDAMWNSGGSFALRYVYDTEKYPHDFITTFAPIPTPGPGGEGFNGGGINNWFQMHPKSKVKDATWAFMRYWLTDGAVFMLKGGKIPAFPGTDPDAITAGILGPKRNELFDSAAFKKTNLDPSIAYVTDTETRGSAEIQKIAAQQTDRFLIGEITADQWVTTVKQQADEAIKKAGA
jgi:multiple sugar transport system substrate-binding protein